MKPDHRNPMQRALAMAQESALLIPPRTAVLTGRFMDIYYKCVPEFDDFGHKKGYKEEKLVTKIPVAKHLAALDELGRNGKGRRLETMSYLKSRHLLPGEALTYNIQLWAEYEMEADEGDDGFGGSVYPIFGSLIVAYSPKLDGAEGVPVLRLRGLDMWYLYGLPDGLPADDGFTEAEPVCIGSICDWQAANPGGFAYDKAWATRPKKMSFVLYQGLAPINERAPQQRLMTKKGSSGFHSPDGGVFTLSEDQVSGLFRRRRKR